MSELIRIACPRCNKAYKVSAEFTGRRTRCRKCGEIFTVTAQGAAHPTVTAPGDHAVGHDRDSPLVAQIRQTLLYLINNGKGGEFHWDDLLESCQPVFLADLETHIVWNPGEEPGTGERTAALRRTAREHLLKKMVGSDLCIKGPDRGMYATYWLTPVAELLVEPIPRQVEPAALLKSIQELANLDLYERMGAAGEVAAHGPAAAPAAPALLNMAFHDLPGGQWKALAALASIGEPAIKTLSDELKLGNSGRCAQWTPPRTTFADQAKTRFRAQVCGEVLMAIGTKKALAVLDECRKDVRDDIRNAVAAITQERAAAIRKAAASKPAR